MRRSPDYDPYPWLDRSQPFDPTVLFSRPDFATLDQRERKRVAVVGGGIAGLAAAYELQQLGHDPVVFEASARWGGRICTKHYADGTYGELGAMRIPADHRGVLGYATAFGIPTRDFVHINGAAWLKFRGRSRTRLRNYATLAWGAYPNLRLRTRVLPTTGWTQIATKALATARGSDWWSIFRGELVNQDWLTYETVTLWQYLQGQTTARRMPLLYADEWEWIGRGSGLYWFESASLLEHLVEVGSLLAEKKLELVGGMERLVEGFVGAIEDRRLRLGARVESIETRRTGIGVTWRDQFGAHPEHFDFAIAAVPAPAVLQIQMSDDLLPTVVREALSGLRYESAAKTVVHCRRRTWEINDQIAGGGSFTDLPIQQCWYPSDNARPMTLAEENAIADGTAADMLNFQGGEATVTPILTGWTPQDPGVSVGPGAFVGAYMWGANAQRFLALGSSQRDDLVLRCLEQLHPGISQDIDDLQHLCWDENPVPGSGAFAFFRPGEYSRYQRVLLEPRPNDGRPRLFFAGEHLAVLHAWIQSGLLTAWSAVAGVISQ